jgi:hypothetical protein
MTYLTAIASMFINGAIWSALFVCSMHFAGRITAEQYDGLFRMVYRVWAVCSVAILGAYGIEIFIALYGENLYTFEVWGRSVGHGEFFVTLSPVILAYLIPLLFLFRVVREHKRGAFCLVFLAWLILVAGEHIARTWPNKSLQPTPTAVMPPAAQEITPAVGVAEH